MIKCIGFLRSLKQFFIISLISCFTLLVGSSVNARTNYNDSNWLIYQPVGDREYLNNYSLLVDSDGDFDSFYNSGESQLVLYYPPNNGGNGKQVYGWINGKLYYYGDYNNQGVRQGFIKNFMHITKDELLDVNNGPYRVWSGNLTSDEFYSQNHSFTNIYSMSTAGSSNPYLSLHFRTFCLEDSNGVDVYCWSCSSDSNLYQCNSQVENSQNYTISDFDSVFDVPYDFSPFAGNGGNGSGNDYITIELTGDDYINYFERNPNYNFDKNICYVGTNDLTTTGISGIPYYEGTGKNIVELFAHLYGNTFTTKNLGSFLNTWNINYGTWYLYGNRDELDNPLYNAYYSLNSGFYLDYSDNLTNPFLINPTAIYFMASTISDYGNRSTLGEEIATYCYYKLQRENPNVFEGINITDNHDSSIDENVGTFIENWNRYSYNQSGINVVSETWSDSDLDYFSGSDFVDFGTFFHESMQKLKSNFNVSDFDLGLGVLPGYIIFFLITLVLFRFLSH